MPEPKPAPLPIPTADVKMEESGQEQSGPDSNTSTAMTSSLPKVVENKSQGVRIVTTQPWESSEEEESEDENPVVQVQKQPVIEEKEKIKVTSTKLFEKQKVVEKEMPAINTIVEEKNKPKLQLTMTT